MHDEDEIGGAAAGDAAAREPRHVPLSAMLSERERRRAAERELEALRAHKAQPAPDALEALNARFHRSEAEARARHGGEAVDAAQAWSERRMRDDPAFARAVLSHDDPYALALERHGADGPAPEADALAAPPPRSLVSAPSAGGAAHTPVGPGQAFDALFNR